MVLEYLLGKKTRAYVHRPHERRIEIVITGEEEFPHLSDNRMVELMKLLNKALRQK